MTSTPRRNTAVPIEQRQSAILSRRISSVYNAGAELSAVFDIGSRVLRAGISGECAVRCILQLPEPLTAGKPEQDLRLGPVACEVLSDEFLGELDDRIDKTLREAVNRQDLGQMGE